MATLQVLLVALIFGAIFTALLAGPIGWRRPGREDIGPALFFLFLILFPLFWVAALWIQPVGPTVMGVAWIPLLFVGLIVVLLVAAAAPPRGRVMTTTTTAAAEPSETGLALGAFFWILMLVLGVLILFSLL